MFYKNLKNHAESFLNDYKKKSPATFAAAQEVVGGLLILDGFVGIDNPLGGKKRSGIFGTLATILIGLIFIFGITFIGNMMGINKMTAITNATVVTVSQPTYDTTNSDNNSGGTCTLQARYKVNGQEYTKTSSSGSNSACALTQGQTISINYDPNHPGAFIYDLNSFKLATKLFQVAGLVAVVVGTFTFLIRLFSIIFGWKILKSGRALAKTLPEGTDLSSIKNEIKENFAKSIFGMGGKNTNSQNNIPKKTVS